MDKAAGGSMGMNKNRRKVLCIAVAAIIAIWGMCFAKMEADSFFESHSIGTQGDSLTSSEFIQRAQIRAEEISGLRTPFTFLLKARQEMERNCVRLGLFFVLLAFLLANSQFLAAARTLQLPEHAFIQRVIINYIHRQDGRKGSHKINIKK